MIRPPPNIRCDIRFSSHRKCSVSWTHIENVLPATAEARVAAVFFVVVEVFCATLVAFATTLHVMQHVMRPLIFRMKNQRPKFLSARLLFFFFSPPTISIDVLHSGLGYAKRRSRTRTRKLVAGAFQQRTNACSCIIKKAANLSIRDTAYNFYCDNSNAAATSMEHCSRRLVAAGCREKRHMRISHLWIVFVHTRTDAWENWILCTCRVSMVTYTEIKTIRSFSLAFSFLSFIYSRVARKSSSSRKRNWFTNFHLSHHTDSASQCPAIKHKTKDWFSQAANPQRVFFCSHTIPPTRTHIVLRRPTGLALADNSARESKSNGRMHCCSAKDNKKSI